MAVKVKAKAGMRHPVRILRADPVEATKSDRHGLRLRVVLLKLKEMASRHHGMLEVVLLKPVRLKAVRLKAAKPDGRILRL